MVKTYHLCHQRLGSVQRRRHGGGGRWQPGGGSGRRPGSDGWSGIGGGGGRQRGGGGMPSTAGIGPRNNGRQPAGPGHVGWDLPHVPRVYPPAAFPAAFRALICRPYMANIDSNIDSWRSIPSVSVSSSRSLNSMHIRVPILRRGSCMNNRS